MLFSKRLKFRKALTFLKNADFTTQSGTHDLSENPQKIRKNQGGFRGKVTDGYACGKKRLV